MEIHAGHHVSHQAGRDIQPGAFDRWPDGKQAMALKPGLACRLLLGSATVITGYIDEVSPSYDDKTHRIQVTGRDTVCDLVDCCHDGAVVQFKDRTLLQIAQEVCLPFGIQVAALCDVGAPFPLKTYNTSSTVMTFLGQLARQRGILAVSLGDGKLTLTRSGTSRAGAALELGKNIKSGQGNFSNADRFSHYRFKGQGVVPLNQKLDLTIRAG